MNVLEKILEEIEEKIKNTNNCSENLAFIDGIQHGLIEAKKIIRSHMDDTSDVSVENNIDRMISIDSAIKILKNMQNPRIDYADMVGAPAFCYGKRYVFPEPEDYAIETALIVLNEKEKRGANRDKNTNVNSNDGWIPVEEELPEARTTVLACFDNGDVESLWQDWEENVENLKHFELGDEEKDGGIKEVIAWQPLPEPYKEGK